MPVAVQHQLLAAAVPLQLQAAQHQLLAAPAPLQLQPVAAHAVLRP